MEKEPRKIKQAKKNKFIPTNTNEMPEKPTANPNKKTKRIRRIRIKDKTKGKISSTNTTSSDAFLFDEIANNKEASALITDLVKCYTCNSTLPQSELDLLNKTLQEKTVSVISNILNKCVDKLFNKLINTDIMKELLCKKSVDKKNAFCQTDDTL